LGLPSITGQSVARGGVTVLLILVGSKTKKNEEKAALIKKQKGNVLLNPENVSSRR